MHQAHFSLRLLGGFEVLRNGRPLTRLCQGKMRALLAYLAAESAQAHTRQALAGLLWPERDEDHARQSLRQALTDLRAALGDQDGPEALLTISRDSIAFNRGPHELDIATFETAKPSSECPIESLKSRAHCRQCHLVAVQRYRGPFLAGLSVPDAPEFESWLALKRERFGRRASEMFGHLAACYEQSGQYGQALRYARTQLRVDPWHEEAHRQVIRLLALGGSRNAAVAHYRRVRALLAEELGVEPEERTRALYESIRAERFGSAAVVPAERIASDSPWEVRACTAAPRGHAGERRLLTVLCAELRCAPDADPEELHERAARFGRVARRILRRHGAAVQGGNLELMAYFGHPLACEQAGLQAVRAALALRHELGGLEPRIRVHTGTVFLPPRRRSACEPDFEVIGPVPRLARALQAASPGTDVAISEATFELVRPEVQCKGLPRYRVRDASGPLRVYEVLRLAGSRERGDEDRTGTGEGGAAPPGPGHELHGAMLALEERHGHALDRLGSAKGLAQLASNLGAQFSETRLAELLRQTGYLGREPRAVIEDLDRLVSGGILIPWTGESGLTGYRFREPLLREVAYRSQSRAQRCLCRQLLASAPRKRRGSP